MKNPFSSSKTARALREELDNLIASETDRKNRLANLEAEFDTAFSSDDIQRATKAEAALTKAKAEDMIASQIGDRKRATLQARIDEAEAAEAAEALAKQVKTITEKRDAVAKVLKERIPAIAAEISSLAIKAGEIDAAIRSMPDGVPGIRSAFLQAFTVPEIPEELISSKQVSLWVFKSTGQPLDVETSKRVTTSDGRTGFINLEFLNKTTSTEVERRSFIEEVFTPKVSSNFPYSTLEELVELLGKFDLGTPSKPQPQTRLKPV